MRLLRFKTIRKIKNKKYKKAIGAIVLALMLIAVGANIYRINKDYHVVFDEIVPEIKKINRYNIDVEFYEEEKIIEGVERITYVNNSNKIIDEIYFHIYPNVFKSKDTTPFSKDEMDLAYIDGFEPGYINIKSVKSSKKDLSFLIIGKGNSILKANLDQEIEPGDEANIYIEFMVKIPPTNSRFGWGKNTINLGNWYPIAAVIDDEGWNLDPYYSIGDPFYSDIGNYRVTITMPTNYVVAASGDLVKKESIEGNYDWSFKADKVRDFAMIASDKFKVLEDEVDDIAIRSYYFEDESAETALNSARDAVEIYNRVFGKYPYKHFSVAASDFFIGGMEYPKLVFIDEGMYKGNNEFLEYVIVHETAHQWWYGVVGNNEVKEAWLDEALTEYSTLLYYEEKYGKSRKDEIYRAMIVDVYNRCKNDMDNKENILRNLGDFENSREYHALVYCKGAMFFENLRKELGDEMFFDSLKVYYDKYKYKNATTEDFIEICEIVTDKELKNMFKNWLMGLEE